MKVWKAFRRQAAGPVWVGLSVALTVLPAQAQVYKCADSAGRVTYQAQPCPDKSVGQQVSGEKPAAAAPPPERAAPRRTPGQAGWSIATEDGAVAAPAPSPRQPGAGVAPRAVAPTSRPQGAEQWGVDADVLIVSGYEFSAEQTQVHVNHPDRPVLLVLTSYESTQWKVLPAPGTRIKAIVVGSYQSRATVQPLAQVPIVQDELPYAVETGSMGLRELISKLHGRYGVNKVVAYRGGYSLPALIPVRGPYPPDPHLTLEGLRPEVPRVRINFDLISVDGRRLPWSNTGPRDGQRFTGVVQGGGLAASTGGAAVVSADGREGFRLEGNGGTLRWFPQGFGGPSQKIEVPKHLPPLSWGCGLAWDTTRGVLALVSFGGEGYFYRYDTRRRQWIDARSLNNRDLLGVAWNPATGGYAAISNEAELLLFNAEAELNEVLPLSKLLPDLNSTFDRGNRRLEGLTVAAQGQVVAIANVRDGTVTHIWTYELGSRKAQLTYKTVD